MVCIALMTLTAPHADAARPSKAARQAAETFYEEAKAAYEAGDMDRALAKLRSAIESVPKPVYVYNLGRTLEGAGRLRAAYDTFLRAQALPDISADLRQLAAAGVERLAAVRNKAVLDVSGFAEGSMIQVDADLVTDAAAARTLEPGRHQVCALSPAKDRLSCFSRPLNAGLRATFPPEVGLRSTLTWPDDVQPSGLSLGGHRLLVPVGSVRTLDLDAGRLSVALQTADGRSFEGDVDLLPEATRELALAAPAPPTPAGAPTAPEEETAAGPGVAPWIVVGVGAAAAGTGAVLWGLSAGVAGVPASQDVGGVPIYDKTQAERRSEWEDAQTQELAGAILVGVGAAALLGGAVWLLVGSNGDDESDDSAAAVAAAPWVTTGGAGAAVMGRF